MVLDGLKQQAGDSVVAQTRIEFDQHGRGRRSGANRKNAIAGQHKGFDGGFESWVLVKAPDAVSSTAGDSVMKSLDKHGAPVSG
jgi:hypothetical protein